MYSPVDTLHRKSYFECSETVLSKLLKKYTSYYNNFLADAKVLKIKQIISAPFQTVYGNEIRFVKKGLRLLETQQTRSAIMSHDLVTFMIQ